MNYQNNKYNQLTIADAYEMKKGNSTVLAGDEHVKFPLAEIEKYSIISSMI